MDYILTCNPVDCIFWVVINIFIVNQWLPDVYSRMYSFVL